MIYNSDSCCLRAALSSGVRLTVSMTPGASSRITVSAKFPGSETVSNAVSRAIANNDFSRDLITVCSDAVMGLVSTTLAESVPRIELIPADPVALIPADLAEAIIEDDLSEESGNTNCVAPIPLVPADPVDPTKQAEVQETVDHLIRFVRVQNLVSE